MPPKNYLRKDVQQANLFSEPGETIFHKPYLNLLLEEEHRKHNALLLRLGAGKDDRSTVIISAMVCEAYLDRMLSLVFPRYEKDMIDDAKQFTFSMKIKILKALCIVPKFITDAADMLRDARNKFAHNLSFDKLSDLPANTQDRMRGLFQKRWQGHQVSGLDFSEVFKGITDFATSSLIAYYVCLYDFNDAIRDPKFEARLRRHSEKRAIEMTRLILEHINARPINDEPIGGGIFI